MRNMVIVACIAGLAGCYNSVTTADLTTCDPEFPLGQLHVVLDPGIGPFGWGETVAVGDTLALTAEVRPVVGASIDFWGNGLCRTDYGTPTPAAIQWSSSDTRIATVSTAGVVFGRERGTAIITARAPTHNASASREIGVWIRGTGSP